MSKKFEERNTSLIINWNNFNNFNLSKFIRTLSYKVADENRKLCKENVEIQETASVTKGNDLKDFD